MESELQRWVFFAFMFLVTALRSRPTWGERKGREIRHYAVFFYCGFFVAIYAGARLFEPQSLVADGVLRDGFLWWTAAAATAGVFGGSMAGQWLRRVTAGWSLDSGEVRYRLAEPPGTGAGDGKKDRHAPD
ncbi:hypothetical protein [Thioalkalivibrio sp. XN8]|uniref:hypothetical protein n=1 Tax=Thioalkalivibrio sp. XN8 TaxID=2712863 RepID=UPI0013EB4572|nr:hypothetical protein [Thioalkalivibrio sp. XN8]NGP52109.1 hypothetical protein [Thioalkalivibrio sp. XN8]